MRPLPALLESHPGTDFTVVMDNLQVHKIGGVREAIEKAEARLLFLPPYSPDVAPSATTALAQPAFSSSAVPSGALAATNAIDKLNFTGLQYVMFDPARALQSPSAMRLSEGVIVRSESLGCMVVRRRPIAGAKASSRLSL